MAQGRFFINYKDLSMLLSNFSPESLGMFGGNTRVNQYYGTTSSGSIVFDLEGIYAVSFERLLSILPFPENTKLETIQVHDRNTAVITISHPDIPESDTDELCKVLLDYRYTEDGAEFISWEFK